MQQPPAEPRLDLMQSITLSDPRDTGAYGSARRLCRA
jgi:hypothetical protein